MKTIELTRGYVAVVDDEDYDLLSAITWQAHIHPNVSLVYAKGYIRVGEKTTKPLMHRLILGVSDPRIFVDHRDGDGLNNKRPNLRICDRSSNQGNRRKKTIGSSQFKGVTHRGNRWYACCKDRYLGCFLSETEAALAYNEEAIHVFGEFASLNDIQGEGRFHND